jgi:hypothetical protein
LNMARQTWKLPEAALSSAAMRVSGGTLVLEWMMPADQGGAGKGCGVAEVLIVRA